ncbi:MAG TPA: tetratricopeptide repeat protein [Verrucomicrobiae bacterium]|jgi:tetratricopeptide (TPR) repeat protein|nr:tetratricopeptide repeat protein [Verrucomicrobiae bacterium]
MPPPNVEPPRSDRVNVQDLGDDGGESSSKDTQIDLSPPAGDEKSHPNSQGALSNGELESEGGGVNETHPWDPHKAAKDIEVGDFYFKRKNYGAAESRYREALLYKQDDATATFRLAESLEKLARPDEAREEYESYLKILPNGPKAAAARKALERLSSSASNRKASH